MESDMMTFQNIYRKLISHDMWITKNYHAGLKTSARNLLIL